MLVLRFIYEYVIYIVYTYILVDHLSLFLAEIQITPIIPTFLSGGGVYLKKKRNKIFLEKIKWKRDIFPFFNHSPPPPPATGAPFS